MNRLKIFMTIIPLIIFLLGCSNARGEKNEKAKEQKILIVYYSKSNHTKRLAEQMKEQLSARLYEIKPERPYNGSDNDTHYQAQEEIRTGKLRKNKGIIPDVSQYDLILVGGPVWSGRIANPLMEYLNNTDFKGKKIAPFWTYVTSQKGYEADFVKFVRNGKILKGQGFNNVNSSKVREIIDNWSNKVLS